MGQYWKFVNIDRKEELRNDGGLRLGSMLTNGCLEQLVDLLRKPKWIPLSAGTQAHLLLAKSKSTASALLALPQEVIDIIVHELCSDSPESVVYLSLTCVYFFRLLGPEFQKALATDNAPWAGHRLVIIGDYADGVDVEGICTSEELRQFEEDKDTYGENPLYRLPENRVMCVRDRHTNARRRWHEADDIRRPGDLEERVKEKLIFNGSSLFSRLATLARRPQLTTNHHEQHRAVLRNLVTKQYVRDKAIAESDYAYSLGEVVAIFTTWGNGGSGMDGLKSQGLWVGHRFDIATMTDVSEDGWTDVSELAVEKLRECIGLEKKDVKRACDALVEESVTPDSSVHEDMSDDSYVGEDDSFHSGRQIWIHTSPPEQGSV